MWAHERKVNPGDFVVEGEQIAINLEAYIGPSDIPGVIHGWVPATICACGTPVVHPSRFVCGVDVNPHPIPCGKVVCSEICPDHRHAHGTMGSLVNHAVTINGLTFLPDNDSMLGRFRAWWRNKFWKPQRKAQHFFNNDFKKLLFPVPIPLPELTLVMDGFRFKSVNGEMRPW